MGGRKPFPIHNYIKKRKKSQGGINMIIIKKDKTYKITEYVNIWNVKLLNSIIDVNFELSKKDFLTIDEVAIYIKEESCF